MTTFVRCVTGLVRLDSIQSVVRRGHDSVYAILGGGEEVCLSQGNPDVEAALRVALVEIGLEPMTEPAHTTAEEPQGVSLGAYRGYEGRPISRMVQVGKDPAVIGPSDGRTATEHSLNVWTLYRDGNNVGDFTALDSYYRRRVDGTRSEAIRWVRDGVLPK